jgi:DNA polymerase type B, organellar and viral
MLSTQLTIPEWLGKGIKPNHRGSRMDKYIYGADTETVHGKPNSLQFYSEDVACDDIFFVDEKTACKKFLAWCGSRRRNCMHVVYVHVLEFDLIELLWGAHAKLVADGSEFNFRVGNWHIHGVYGTPTFARISNGHDRTIMLIDSFSFYRGSLDAAAKIFCPSLPKLKRPADIGEVRYSSVDAGFVAYAMRDAVIAYHIGRAIEAMHQEYDLQQCVSVADMASRIFRHKFLTYTIPQPPRDIIECALLAYHGGKNNVSSFGSSGWHVGVTSLDIKSAYPHAMRNMPAFSNVKLYRRYAAKAVRSVPEFGVYYVTGHVAKCEWPSVFSHGFKPLAGDINRIAMHGYELNESLRSGEMRATKIRGWCYDAEKDHQAPALRAFVDDFFAKKETAKDKGMRQWYKFTLNSISGKFIQTRKRGTCAYTDIDAEKTVNASELVAGGMFHPFIAAGITAHTRARIHGLEHKYKALHTATDGIFTKAPCEKIGKSSSLGALSIEAKGDLLLIRNKCYILYTKDGEIKSRAFKGKRIGKYAKHGFQGTVYDLERLIATGRRKYTVNKPWRLREAMKRKLTPNLFTKRDYTLKIGPLTVQK